MLKNILGAILFVISASPVFAQSLAAGQIEIAGSTAFAANRQTVTGAGSAAGQNIDTTTATLDLAYYPSERWGIGGFLVSNTAALPFDTDTLSVKNTLVSALVRYRTPLGERASFVLTGGVGRVSTTIEGTGAEGGDASNRGLAVSGGAGVLVFLNDLVGLSGGMVYQRSKFDEDGGDLTVAGLTTAVGFVLRFNTR